MLQEVVKSNPDKSVVLSAFSVLTPLAQLSLATEGASHDELLNALGLPNDNAVSKFYQVSDAHKLKTNNIGHTLFSAVKPLRFLYVFIK